MCIKMQNTLFDAMVSCRSLNSYCASYSFVTPAKLVLLDCFVSFSSLNSFSVFFFCFCRILVYFGIAFNVLHFFAIAIRRCNLMQFRLCAPFFRIYFIFFLFVFILLCRMQFNIISFCLNSLRLLFVPKIRLQFQLSLILYIYIEPFSRTVR